MINAQGEPSQKPSSIDVTIPQDAEYVNSVDPLLRWMLGSRPTAAQEGAGAFGRDSGGAGAPGVQDGAHGILGQNKTAPEVGTAVKTDRDTYTVVQKLKESIPALKEVEPVARTGIQAIERVSGSTMAEKARNLFETVKGIVTRPDFGDVEINGRSVKDDLSHGVGPAKAATIATVPEVIRRGQQIYFAENWKNRGYDGYVFALSLIHI